MCQITREVVDIIRNLLRYIINAKHCIDARRLAIPSLRSLHQAAGEIQPQRADEIQGRLAALDDIHDCGLDKQKRRDDLSHLVVPEGLDSRRGLRGLVARGRKRPPEVCSVPLVLRVRPPTHKKRRDDIRHLVFFWQGRKASNPRPMVLETSTLPTELHPFKQRYYIKLVGVCQGVLKK